MKKRSKEMRSGYLLKALGAMQGKDNDQAMNTIIAGLDEYSDRVTDGINPFDVSDTPLLIVVLESIASQLRQRNANYGSMADLLKRMTKEPQITQTSTYVTRDNSNVIRMDRRTESHIEEGSDKGDGEKVVSEVQKVLRRESGGVQKGSGGVDMS